MSHPLQVTIPAAAKGKRLSTYLAEAGYPITADCGGRGICGKCRVTLLSGSFYADPEGMTRAVPDGDAKILSCRAWCTGDAAVILLPVSEGEGLTVKATEEAVAAPQAGIHNCGVALDIGTTTLAAALVSLESGLVLRTVSRLNPQRSFGADVMSRIGAVMQDESSLYLMQKLLLNDVRLMLRELTDGQPIPRMTVAGNPTMLHLFCGISPAGMGAYPFTPAFTEAKILTGAELELPVDTVTLLPSVSAFIGGDITAGMLAQRITDHDEPVLLTDMGTNGEMILFTGKNRGAKLYGTSTAAGPALEGAGISTGVGGISGAVCGVKFNGLSMQIETVNHAPPVGICGSGLIDLVAVLLQRGLLDETGYLEEDPFPYAEGLTLTGADIRAFQLAKSALRAGMEVLCDTAGLSPRELSRIYIAGGLGYYMNIHSAAAVGLLPDCPRKNMVSVGNTALTGAAMLLCDPTLTERLARDTAACETVELNLSPGFSDKFMEYMMFPFDEEA